MTRRAGESSPNDFEKTRPWASFLADHGRGTLGAVEQARERLEPYDLRSPLVPWFGGEQTGRVYLKLENLQPVGSFKLRGALNAVLSLDDDEARRGVTTASAGNMALGLAYAARLRGIPCRVLVPEGAPAAKVDAVRRLGAEVTAVPYDRWWRAIEEHRAPGIEGSFVHPVADPRVIAGNATVGLEVHQEAPDADAVFVPYGGGGLSSGIACGLRAAGSSARVWACEVDSAAPLAASLAAGRPVAIEHRRSFVDGIGGKSVLPQMWPLVRALLAGSQVQSLQAVAGAVRELARHARVVAEGAGAAALAAATADGAPGSVRVAVISGGNLDPAVLASLLEGGAP